MAFCTNCGTKLGENAKFCTNCGTAVKSAQKKEEGVFGEIDPNKIEQARAAREKIMQLQKEMSAFFQNPRTASPVKKTVQVVDEEEEEGEFGD